MANFGIGLGAFTDGLSRGIGLRQQIDTNRRQRDQQKRQDERQAIVDQSYKDARSAYDSAVADNVLQQAGQANSDGSAPAFDAEAANKKATQKIGSFSDFFYKTQLPKVIDAYVEAGDLEAAEKLNAFAQNKDEKKRTELFGRALNSFYAGQTDGNYEPFAKRAVELLNSGNYGVTATGYDFAKDSDGNVTGVQFKLKDGDREYSHAFNSMEDVAGFLAGEMSPETRIKRLEAQQQAADKLKSQVAAEERKAQIGLAKDIALDDAKTQNKLWLDSQQTKQTGSRAQQDFEFMQGVLKSNGYTDEEIKAFVPAMLKLNTSDYRKGKSPEEFAQQLTLEIMKSPLSSRMTPDEIQAKVQELIRITQDVGRQAQPSPQQQPGIIGR